MSGPWEKYAAPPQNGPWDKYAAPDSEAQLSNSGPADAQAPNGSVYRFPDELRAFQFSREMLSTKSKDPKDLDFIAKNYQGSLAPTPAPTEKQAPVSGFAAPGVGFLSGLSNVGLGAGELAAKGLSFLGSDAAGRFASETIPGARKSIAAATAPYEEQYPMLTGAGKLGGEVVGTLPVGFAAAAVPGLSPAARAAFRTGGMNFGPLSVGNVALRAAAGGTVGAGSAALTGDDVGIAAGLGAALPFGLQAGARAAQGVYNSLKPIFSPSSVALNALRESGGDGLEDVLRQTQGMATTPGFRPTLTERAIEGGMVNPSLAALEARSAVSSREANKAAVQVARERVSALEEQKKRIDAEILSRQSNNLPPGDLSKVQNELSRSLEREYAGLIQQSEGLLGQSRQLGGTLPEGQAAAGQSLIDLARADRKAFTPTLRAKYENAFKLAGDTRIDITPIVEEAEKILGQRLVDIKPANAPATVRALAEMRPAPPPPEMIGRGPLVSTMRKPASAPAPIPGATLEQLDALRKAINQDIAAATASSDPIAAQKLRFLGQLHPLLDKAADASKLSPEAKEAYTDALDTYRTVSVPKFKTGIAADITRDTSKNQSKLLPDNVVREFVGNETNAQQFLTTYGRNPQAVQSLRDGFADMFRANAIDPVTKAVKPEAAAAFLQKNKPVIDLLQRNGVDIQSSLQAVQQRATQLSEGMADLTKQAEAVRKKIPTGDPKDLVTRLLDSGPDMDFTLSKLSPAGKSALADEVVTRVNSMSPDEAMKFLTDKPKTITKAVGGKEGFASMMDLVKWRVEASNIEKSMPKNIGPTIAVDTGNATPAQLTDLMTLAKDIKRMQYASETARSGLGVASPAAKALGTESSQQGGVSASQIPTLLDYKVTIAKNIWQKLEEKVNARAASQLAHYMITDPDAALRALEAQTRRRTMLTPPSAASTAAKVAVPKIITNMYGGSSNENALTQ